MASSNFKKALTFYLKNAPAREDVLPCLAHAATVLGGSFFIAYKFGVSASSETGGVTSPEGYPSWKESTTREQLFELIGRAAKD